MTNDIQETGRDNPVDLPGILERIEARLCGKIRYYDSYLHGLSHLRQVAILAGQIAYEEGADVESSMVAGFLHDCGRINDNGGNRHAIDSADMARPLLKELWPHLDADKIYQAIAKHSDGLTTKDPIVGALWDADRITLERLGCSIRLDLLSTQAAKRMVLEKGIAHGT